MTEVGNVHLGWLRVEDSIHAQESTRAAMQLRQKETEEWYKNKISELTQENETLNSDLAALTQELNHVMPEDERATPAGEGEITDDSVGKLFVSSTVKGFGASLVVVVILAIVGLLPYPTPSGCDVDQFNFEDFSIPLEDIKAGAGLDKSDPAYFQITELKGLLRMVGQALERCTQERKYLADNMDVQSADLARELAELREAFNITLILLILSVSTWYFKPLLFRNTNFRSIFKVIRGMFKWVYKRLKFAFEKKDKADYSNMRSETHLLVSRKKRGKSPMVVAAPRTESPAEATERKAKEAAEEKKQQEAIKKVEAERKVAAAKAAELQRQRAAEAAAQAPALPRSNTMQAAMARQREADLQTMRAMEERDYELQEAAKQKEAQMRAHGMFYGQQTANRPASTSVESNKSGKPEFWEWQPKSFDQQGKPSPEAAKPQGNLLSVTPANGGSRDGSPLLATDQRAFGNPTQAPNMGQAAAARTPERETLDFEEATLTESDDDIESVVSDVQGGPGGRSGGPGPYTYGGPPPQRAPGAAPQGYGGGLGPKSPAPKPYQPIY